MLVMVPVVQAALGDPKVLKTFCTSMSRACQQSISALALMLKPGTNTGSFHFTCEKVEMYFGGVEPANSRLHQLPVRYWYS